MKHEKDLLWVEVGNDSVTLKDGAAMPEPKSLYSFSLFLGERSYGRKEFARWSGVEFPKGDGIYALHCKLSVIRRYRKVSSEEFVAAKHTKVELKEVK